MKLNDDEFSVALVQSFGYCMDVLTHLDKPRPIVAIPGTKQQFGLYLCFLVVVGKESKLVTIEIGRASIQNNDEMISFFSALKYAVDEIATDKYSGNFCVEPKQGLLLQLQLNSSRRVYKLGEEVYKLYNLNQLQPNIDVMNKIENNYFPMHEVCLSCDGCMVAYVSKYISQKTNLMFTDFKPIMTALDILHNERYVHSDVRIANLLFPVDSSQGVDSAKLIDFDLAGVEGEPYPQGYNKINERHPDATANSPRSILHDRYSIVSIIENQSFYSMFSDRHKELLTSVKEGKCNLELKEVFNQIET